MTTSPSRTDVSVTFARRIRYCGASHFDYRVFHGDVTTGKYAGTIGYRTFSYDPTALILCDIPANESFATPGYGSFAVSFTIFEQTFTEADEMDYPIRPYFQFTASGVPITLDFAISEAGNQGLLGSAGNPTTIDKPGVALIFMSKLSPATGGGFNTEVFAKCIPEPSTYFLLATGLLGLMAMAGASHVACKPGRKSAGLGLAIKHL